MNCLNLYGRKELHGCFKNYPMRILITGGFGFIGGRLAKYLQKTGHQIVLGSRKADSQPDWLLQTNVVQTIWGNAYALEQICAGVDVVIHAAGMNAQDCSADPLAALEFNGLGTARLVEAAIRAKVKQFIYLSTAHVYASPLTGIITEDSCPRNLHPYATSHLAGENVVLGASQRGQIDGIVLRLSNAFGVPVYKEQNCWMLLVNDLCRQAVETGKMVLQTSGQQQRDFIALTELSGIVEHLAVAYSAKVQPAIFNVGSGVSQSVLAMAQLIQQRCIEVLGFKPLVQRVGVGSDESYSMLNYRADKLALLGIKVNNTENAAEIDMLLRFCNTVFKQTQCTKA